MTTAEKLIESMNAPDYAQIHKRVFRIAFDCLTRCWPPEHSVEYFNGKAYPVCALAYADMGDNELGKEIVMEIYRYLEIKAKEMTPYIKTEKKAEDDVLAGQIKMDDIMSGDRQ